VPAASSPPPARSSSFEDGVKFPRQVSGNAFFAFYGTAISRSSRSRVGALRSNRTKPSSAGNGTGYDPARDITLKTRVSMPLESCKSVRDRISRPAAEKSLPPVAPSGRVSSAGAINLSTSGDTARYETRRHSSPGKVSRKIRAAKAARQTNGRRCGVRKARRR